MRGTALSFLVLTALLSGACVIAVVGPAAQGRYWPPGSFRKSLSLQPGGSVSLENRAGDIVFLFEPDASAQRTAAAPAGRVTSEFNLGQLLPAQEVTARLAEGKAVVELTAVRGEISIRKGKKAR
jgi:hypothetical protein